MIAEGINVYGRTDATGWRIQPVGVVVVARQGKTVGGCRGHAQRKTVSSRHLTTAHVEREGRGGSRRWSGPTEVPKKGVIREGALADLTGRTRLLQLAESEIADTTRC